MAENGAVGINGDVSDLGGWTAKNLEAGGADNYLKHRIVVLEREKRDLVRKNGEMNAAVDKLAEEKAEELEQLEKERKALELMKKRASDLEGVVARLHHNLVTSTEAGEEASREKEALRGEIQEMKKEKDALLLRLCEKTDELKQSKSDSQSRISELEKEIEELKEREISARREKVAADEQSKVRLDEMEREIVQLKKEKEEIEDGMATSRTELKRSEEKVTEMEGRLARLLKRSEVAHGEIEGVAEAAEGDGGLRGLHERKRFPAAAAVSAGVVVAALAVCYLKFKKSSTSVA